MHCAMLVDAVRTYQMGHLTVNEVCMLLKSGMNLGLTGVI